MLSLDLITNIESNNKYRSEGNGIDKVTKICGFYQNTQISFHVMPCDYVNIAK